MKNLRLNFSFGRRTPVILQNEVAECGLASLAMVAGYHGHEVDLFAMRQKFGITIHGMTLKMLIGAAERMSLSARALRLEPADVPKLRTPAILHWDLNHFVVLAGTSRKGVTLHDPGRGVVQLDWEEFSQHFTGVALELVPAPNFEAKKETQTLKLTSLWRSSVGLGRSLVQVFLLALAIQLFSLVLPYFTQLVVDQVVVTSDRNLLLALALGFGLLTVVKSASEALRSWSILYVGTSLNLQLSSNLLNHLLKLPLDFFQKRHIGDIQSRFASLGQVRTLLTNGFVEGIIDGAMLVTTLCLMLVYSPKLTVVALTSAVVYAVLRISLYQPLRQGTLDSIVKRSRTDSLFLESLRAMLPIKVFGREAERKVAWENHHAQSLNSDIRVGRLQIVFQTTYGLAAGLENVLLIALGAMAVLDQSLSVGMLMAFLAYRGQFSGKCQTLIDKLFEYRMLGLHMERLSDIVFTPIETSLDGHGFANGTCRGDMVLRDVGFRYSEGHPWLFRHLNLIIKAGECVAFAGRSGQGKTTLLKILMGLIEPTEGEVLVDGADARKIGLRHYRKQCAAVMQEDRLISGTIRDNISFQDPEADGDRVDICAEHACILEDIKRMPMGYESLIGDMGSALSGGQQQRLLLARALYASPRILFLDEATSALDLPTQQRVNDNLKRLGVTRIMVAHRKETLEMADRVVDLAQLVASGELRLVA
ncbi:MAG: peptidase domain-containing ABC transporter [Tahibacter sp.]